MKYKTGKIKKKFHPYILHWSYRTQKQQKDVKETTEKRLRKEQQLDVSVIEIQMTLKIFLGILRWQSEIEFRENLS